MKIWAKNNHKDTQKRKAKLLKKMEKVQEIKEPLEEKKESQFQEKKLYWEIYIENITKEEEWRLKSRNLSLKAGDKNTTFFHNSTNMCRIIN